MLVKRFLDRQTVDRSVRRVDDVHLSIELHNMAIGRVPRDIPSEKPSVAECRTRQRGLAPVAGEDGLPFHLEAADVRAARSRAVWPGDADTRAERRRTRAADPPVEPA